MLVIDKNRCKNCGICISFCPNKCLITSNEINSKGYRIIQLEDESKCSKCGICAIVCSDAAIEVFKQ